MSSCGVNPHVDQFNSESAPPNRYFALTLMVILIPVQSFFLGWYVVRQNHCEYLRRREYGLILLFACGTFWQYLWCVREYIGRENFPCSLHVTLIPVLLLFQASTVAIRCILFHFRIRLGKLLAKIKSSETLQLYLVDVTSQTSTYVEYEMEGIATYNDDDDDADSAVKTSDAYSTGLSSRRPLSVSSFDRRNLRRTVYFASRRFGWHLFSLFTLFALVYVVVEMRGVIACNGCNLHTGEIIILAVAGALICIPNYVILYINRREPDPLRIATEIGLNMLIPAMFFFGWLILHSIDPGNLEESGKWSWNYLVVGMGFSFFFLTIPLQLYYSYTSERSLDGMYPDLPKILQSHSGRELFKAHLAQEFSVENFLFWQYATMWKNKYKKGSKKTAVNYSRIFYTFLESGCTLQINVSHAIQQRVGKHLERLNNSAVPNDALDECVEEVIGLMSQSLSRFYRSDLYEQYRKHVVGHSENLNHSI